jgi:dCMP deaminase
MMNPNDYFLHIARSVALKSKDPSTQVGAVIVDEDNRVVSTGYNGFISKCNEKDLSWERPMKYHFVIHEEMNAILYARRDLRGCRMYLTHEPCENCLKHALQAGMKVFYYGQPYDKFTEDQRRAIDQLVKATGAYVEEIK